MEVSNDFKMYLPSDYIDSNYLYDLNSNYITIRTDNNCYTQYNTTYCDCFRVYPQYNYITSNLYSCSFSNSQYYSSYTEFSSDVFNMPNISNVFITYFIIIFILVYILMSMWKAFRKRLR